MCCRLAMVPTPTPPATKPTRLAKPPTGPCSKRQSGTGSRCWVSATGLQSLNVFRGGSLVQDLLPLPVNHSAGRKVAVAHTADIAPESLLGSLVKGEALDHDGFLRLPVNSSHHQAIAEPGPGLRIVARCPEDGVIEAIETEFDPENPWFFMAVQWHPERSTEISAASRALFARLVGEAERKAGLTGK